MTAARPSALAKVEERYTASLDAHKPQTVQPNNAFECRIRQILVVRLCCAMSHWAIKTIQKQVCITDVVIL